MPLARPLTLLLISLSMIAAVWWRLGAPVTLAHPPLDPLAKLDCVSYAPFRDHQTPFDQALVVSEAQIAQDLTELAKISKCVRTYSVDNGLDKVPDVAAKVGLKVILGVWIGRDRIKNAQLIETAVALVKSHPGVITSIMVGNEVLLRGEMIASDLRDLLRSVKAQVNIPVSYADVWEFWLRYREVANDVDFVTIHMLPYWEDFPVRAEDAAAHVDAVRQRLTFAFPGKEILIGETGWPNQGRMRDVALPSRVNQARFVSEILDRARQENFRVNLFEAYDEPWKRQWEGTVGASWGLFDGWSRQPKYPDGAAVSDHPFWRLQLGCGLVFAAAVFATALLTVRRRPWLSSWPAWIAVATAATVSGILLGIAAEKTLSESYGGGGWLAGGLLLATGIAAPLLSANALMSGCALPAFDALIGSREARARSLPTVMLGFVLLVTTLIAAETALSLVFDPRWRDFPFASLTMATMPFAAVRLLNRPKGTRPLAEAAFAGLFALTALYILFNEGLHNWQSLWTSAAFVVLGGTLWEARSLTLRGTSSTTSAYPPESGLSDDGDDAVPTGRVPEPAL